MRKVVFVAAALVVGGCAQQVEAPVVSGYTPKTVNSVAVADASASFTQRVAARANPSTVGAQAVAPQIQSEDLATISPAAGPDSGRVPVTLAVAPATTGRSSIPPALQAYRVEKSDTLYRIARQFDTTPQEIMNANRMASSADIRPGQTLMVPVGSGRIKNPNTFANKLQQTLPATASANTMAATPETIEPAAGPVSGQAVEQVQSGQRYSLTRHQLEPAPAKKAGSDTPKTGEGAALEPAAGEATSTVTEPSTIEPVAAAPAAVSTMEHKVEKGETVYRIALKYQASVFDIMAANNLDKPQDLQAGMAIKVPVANGATAIVPPVTAARDAGVAQLKETASIEPAHGIKGQRTMQDGAIAGPSSEDIASEMAPVVSKKVVKESASANVKAAMKKGYIDPAAARVKGLAWPVKGKIIKEFGQEGQGVVHSGINIAVPMDTPVLAADKGTVLYAGSGLKTYGNLVLVRHANGLVSAYAHNGLLLVKKGEAIKKGQVLALSGNSGNVEVPQVHFEVRKNARALNPMGLLATR